MTLFTDAMSHLSRYQFAYFALIPLPCDYLQVRDPLARPDDPNDYNRNKAESERALFALHRVAHGTPLFDSVEAYYRHCRDGDLALALGLASRLGASAATALGFYMITLSVVLLLFTLVLYGVAAIIGRVPVGRFGAAALPAQVVQ